MQAPLHYTLPTDISIFNDKGGFTVVDIPEEYRGRLCYQPDAQRFHTPADSALGIGSDDRYTYYADKNRKWPFWTNPVGAAYLLNAMKECDKCVRIAEDRLKIMAKERIEREYPNFKPNTSNYERQMSRELLHLEALGDKMYSDKNNLKKEYITWTQDEYQHPAFQLWYLRLKSIQRYTEGFAACERLYQLGFYKKLKTDFDSFYANNIKPILQDPSAGVDDIPKFIYSAVSLGGGPGFELLALRDYISFIIGHDNMKYVQFVGVSADIDDIWKDYLEAIGFTYIQWDCKERFDNKGYTTVQNEVKTIQDNNLIDQIQRDILIEKIVNPDQYKPLDQTIHQRLSTYNPTLAKQLKLIKGQDVQNDVKYCIDFFMISYAFLMYMSAPHQQQQLFSMLNDVTPNTTHHADYIKGKLTAEGKVENYIPASPFVQSDGILILERVERITPLYDHQCEYRRHVNGINMVQLVRPNDDRQVLFYKSSLPQDNVNRLYSKQGGVVNDNDLPTIFELEHTLDLVAEVKTHQLDSFQKNVLTRFTYPNVPYCDNGGAGTTKSYRGNNSNNNNHNNSNNNNNNHSAGYNNNSRQQNTFYNNNNNNHNYNNNNNHYNHSDRNDRRDRRPYDDNRQRERNHQYDDNRQYGSRYQSDEYHDGRQSSRQYDGRQRERNRQYDDIQYDDSRQSSRQYDQRERNRQYDDRNRWNDDRDTRHGDDDRSRYR